MKINLPNYVKNVCEVFWSPLWLCLRYQCLLRLLIGVDGSSLIDGMGLTTRKPFAFELLLLLVTSLDNRGKNLKMAPIFQCCGSRSIPTRAAAMSTSLYVVKYIHSHYPTTSFPLFAIVIFSPQLDKYLSQSLTWGSIALGANKSFQGAMEIDKNISL